MRYFNLNLKSKDNQNKNYFIFTVIPKISDIFN